MVGCRRGRRHRAGARPPYPPTELDATVADLVAALTAPLAGAVRETKALLPGASSRTWTSSAASSGRRRSVGSASWPACWRARDREGVLMSGMGIDGAGLAARCRSDRSVVDNKIDRRTVAPGARLRAAAPPADRGLPRVTVVDAGLVVVTPLLIKRDRRRRHHSRATPRWSSWLAVGMVAVALSSTPCSASVGGYLSSRIGEGLIFDLRTQVFGHVQRQSLAFFTRTQTGALVSPAQQRRHRRAARLHLDPVEHRLQHRSPWSSSASTMFALSWQVTLLCLALFPLLLLISRGGERPAGRADPAADGRQRRHGQRHDRAVQRRRRDAAQAVRPPRPRRTRCSPTKAATVRDLGVRISLLTRIFFAAMMLVPALATALVYGIGG